MNTTPKKSTAKQTLPNGKQPTTKIAPRKNEHTMLKSVDEYIADHESQQHSPKTIKWHKLALGSLTRFLEGQGITLVKEIEKGHLVDWINMLTKEPGSRGKLRTARTVNYYARSMRAFCRWLEVEGYVELAPSSRVKMPRVGKPLIRIIEFDEFERMLKACTPPQEVGPTADCNAARNRAILWVLWDTGIRLAELCDLRFANFDRSRGVIIVHGKGNKERRIALGRNAQRTLLQYVDRYRPDEETLVELGVIDDDRIFLSESGYALTRDGVSMLFKRLRSRADLPKDKRVSPHIFRHTFAVRYLMLGGDIFTLQELLGHEDMATIKQYMHLNDTLVQEQKRKFSPGDNVPFNGVAPGKKQRSDFREPVKRKAGRGRGLKPTGNV